MQVPLNIFALIAFVFLVSSASASPTVAGSNAERMANGLPPLRPRSFGRALPGFEPTRVQLKRASASPSPSASPSSVGVRYAGRLEVRTTNDSTLGYVRNQEPIDGLSTGDSDLQVTFTTTRLRDAPFNLIATNPVFPAPFYVGAVTSGSQEIGAHSSSKVLFSNVEQTFPHSSPKSYARLNASVESAIWSINSTTKELTAHYVNPNGSKPTTYLAYDSQENSLFFVGNIDAYNSQNNATASVVKLYLAGL